MRWMLLIALSLTACGDKEGEGTDTSDTGTETTPPITTTGTTTTGTTTTGTTTTPTGTTTTPTGTTTTPTGTTTTTTDTGSYYSSTGDTASYYYTSTSSLDGAQLFTDICSGCHGSPSNVNAGDYTEQELIDKMGGGLNHPGGNQAQGAEAEAIAAYLKSLYP